MHHTLSTLLVWTVFEAVSVQQFQRAHLTCRPGIADSNLQIGLTVRKGVGGTCPARLAGRRLKQQGILPALLDLQPPFAERSTPGCISVPKSPACAPTPSAAALSVQQTSPQPVLAATPAPAPPTAAANPATQIRLVAGPLTGIPAAGLNVGQKVAEPGAAGLGSAASGTQAQQHLSAAQRQGPTGAAAAVVVMSRPGASLAARPMPHSQEECMMQPSALGSILHRAAAPQKAVAGEARVAAAAALSSSLPQQEAVSLSEPAIRRQEQQPQLCKPSRVHQPPGKAAAPPQCSGLAAILPRLASKPASQQASSAMSATAAQPSGTAGNLPLRPLSPYRPSSTNGPWPSDPAPGRLSYQAYYSVMWSKVNHQAQTPQYTAPWLPVQHSSVKPPGMLRMFWSLVRCCRFCSSSYRIPRAFIAGPMAHVPVQARPQVKPVSSLQAAAPAAAPRRHQEGAQRSEAQWLLDEEEGFDELLEEVDTMLRDPTDP